MQKASETWDSSSCHSFCSTNERHFRDVDISGEELDFKADHPETVSPRKESSLSKVFEEGEVEEGEIKDSSSVESCDNSNRCRFFEKGRCAFGEKCRFLHQSDKGLYSMFERPRLASRSVYSRRRLPLKTEIPFPAVSPIEDTADWDQELQEAMLRVGFSRKKIPFNEINLTIRTASAFPAPPILENKTSDRRVRYRGEEEPELPGSVVSKPHNTRSSETARSPASKSSRNNKRRHSDTTRSRSRSLSDGRRFSCKCCRTPSPEPGRRRSSSRRPICCNRRKSISASSSSSSPVFRRRGVTRRVRYTDSDPRRRRRDRSRSSIPDRTKIRLYIGGAEASVMRRLGRESRTSKTRRQSKALGPSSPKTSNRKGSHRKCISPTSHSSAKVDKLAASYSPDPRLSDMSISPFSSDSDSENEHAIRRPSDMSISPFSESSSPDRFSVPASRADERSSGVAARNQPSVSRKVSKSHCFALKKRFENDVGERNPYVDQPPVSVSLTQKKRFRSEVQEPMPSAISQKSPKSVGCALKNRLKSAVAKPKPSAVQQEVPNWERFTPKNIHKNDVAQPKSSDVPQETAKSLRSTPKKVYVKDIADTKPSVVPHETLKLSSCNRAKKHKDDFADPKLPAVHVERQKSESHTPKKMYKYDFAEPGTSAVPQETSKSISAKKLKDDSAEPKPPAVPLDMPKFERSTSNKICKNDVAESKSPAVPRQKPKSESFAPQKKFNHLMFDLMKFHNKGSSTKVAVKAKVAHPLEQEEMSVTKVDQKSSAHRGISSLSKKELLLKQLQEVEAAIERMKSLGKQKP